MQLAQFFNFFTAEGVSFIFEAIRPYVQTSSALYDLLNLLPH